MPNKNLILGIMLAGIIFKFFLFFYAEHHVPDAKMLHDSHDYLSSGLTLVKDGVFARGKTENGDYAFELYRTPGYPLFLGLLNGILKIPLNGIILVQIGLTLLAALVTYKIANHIDPRLGWLSALFVICDPTITIFSLLILTESLFLVVITLFVLTFIVYLKQPNLKWLILCAMLLIGATYVRPVGYYLGVFTAVFILYALGRVNIKKAATHALILLMIVYSAIGLWHWRNYQRFSENTFSSIDRPTVVAFGLWKSYSRDKATISPDISPVAYYFKITGRSLLILLTDPASFKYFQSPGLKSFGKMIRYPFIVIFTLGFLIGIIKSPPNGYYHFLLWVIIYFIVTAVAATTYMIEARFRVPMTPLLAIFAAQGWVWLASRFKRA